MLKVPELMGNINKHYTMVKCVVVVTFRRDRSWNVHICTYSN